MPNVKPTHSKIGASSMHRWAACPASVRMSEGIESRSSVYAEEGTIAHNYAATALESNEIPKGMEPEMQAAVEMYYSVVTADSPEERKIYIEHKFDLSTIHPGLYGTADCVVFDPKQKLLRVYDFKYGAGHAVEVENNQQLMYYGLGALLSTNFPCREVELVIVQPRCPHPSGAVRRWRFRSVELIDFAADLKMYAQRTEDPDAPLSAGDHCKFCPAAGICPEIHSAALVMAKEQFSAASTYNAETLSSVLAWLPILESWISNVREFAYAEAMKGRVPPKYKLVQKRATRKWINQGAAQTFLEKECGLTELDIFDFKIKTPAQIEKILKKEQKQELAKVIVAESSGYTLVSEDDSREAIKLDAKTDFTIITE